MTDYFKTMQELEREHVKEAMVVAGWNKTKAARLLNVSRMTLYRLLKRHGITNEQIQ